MISPNFALARAEPPTATDSPQRAPAPRAKLSPLDLAELRLETIHLFRRKLVAAKFYVDDSDPPGSLVAQLRDECEDLRRLHA